MFVKILVAFGVGITLLADYSVFYEAAEQTGPAFPIRLIGASLVGLAIALLSVIFARSVSRWLFMLRLQTCTAAIVIIACIAEKVSPSVSDGLSTAVLLFSIVEVLLWAFFLAEFMRCWPPACR